MKTSALLALAGAMLLAGSHAQAHHSTAMFDRTKEIQVAGVVKEFQFTNPHSWLIVEAPDATGQMAEWSFEAEGPSTLARAGIKKNTINPGDKVTVRTNPMKDGRAGGLWIDLTRPDGTVLNPRATAKTAAR